MSSFFEHFRFLHPLWLLLLLAIPPLWLLSGKIGAPSSVIFPSLSVLGTLGERPRRLLGGFTPLLMSFGLAALTFGLARPVWSETFSSRSESGIDIVITLDVSYSMEIPDFVVNQRRVRRLDVAKAVAVDFIKLRPNDRIGVIAFAGRPYQVSPITLSHDWLISDLQKIELGEIEEQGTAIGSAIGASCTKLEKRDAKSRIIVLVTDGSSNSGKLDPIEAAKLAQKLGIKVYTIAIGTEGGRVSIQQYPQQEFDVKSLQEIAKITGAEFYRAKDTNSLKETFQTINKLEKSEVDARKTVKNTELFHYFAILGLLLCAISVTLSALNPPPTP